MTDEIEERLRRYRPVGPPDSLRARVLGDLEPARRAGRGARWFHWAPAAAMLLLTLLFSWMAANERRLTEARVPPAPFAEFVDGGEMLERIQP